MNILKTTSKSLFFLLLTGFIFMSCSSDDDGAKDEPKHDLLLGTWIFERTEQGEPLTDCQKTSYLKFKNTEKADVLLYIESPDGGCIPQLGSALNYKLVSEKTIKFTVLDDQGNEEKDNFFTSEIVSVNDSKMVLKDFAFIPGKVYFNKQ